MKTAELPPAVLSNVPVLRFPERVRGRGVEGKHPAKAEKVYEEALAKRPDFQAARKELAALRSGK